VLPAARVPVPMVVPPSLNVTVPVGVPAPGAVALTTAVKVTVWPNTEGFASELGPKRTRLNLSHDETMLLVIVLKLPSQLSAAVVVWPLSLHVALPIFVLPAARVPVPMVVPPSLNVTVPVGVPAPGAVALTTAVKVTVWPNTEGFASE